MRTLSSLSALCTLGLLLCGCGGGSGSGNGVTRDIAGHWVRPAQIPGSGFDFTITEQGNTITGAGTYSIEAGRSGTLQVTGSVSGTSVTLTLTPDVGATQTFQGAQTDATHLTGSIIVAGSNGSLPAQFVKQ